MHRDFLFYNIFETKLGWMGILASQAGLKRIILPQESKEKALSRLKNLFTESKIGKNHPFEDLIERIRDYLESKPASFSERLDLADATPFQQKIWQITRSIPYGETRSYSWLACQSNQPKATRAAGQALACNPLPIIIPCHRVIYSDGTPGGFSDDIKWKNLFLEIEQEGIKSFQAFLNRSKEQPQP